jgi:hypothetical protein
VSGDRLALDWCTGFVSCTAGEPRVAGATLQFEGGALLPSPSAPPIAPGGVWIVQPSSCTWCVRVVGAGGAGVSEWPIPAGAAV